MAETTEPVKQEIPPASEADAKLITDLPAMYANWHGRNVNDFWGRGTVLALIRLLASESRRRAELERVLRELKKAGDAMYAFLNSKIGKTVYADDDDVVDMRRNWDAAKSITPLDAPQAALEHQGRERLRVAPPSYISPSRTP